MLEFTGERIIPGQVDPDLFNEHYSRYRFAAGYTKGAQCLDAGCGVGYGAIALASSAARVLAIDNDLASILSARSGGPPPNVTFSVADVCEIPVPSATFDVAVSFEVLEHLPDWKRFLAELRRVLRSTGTVILSTPNAAYYNDSRGDAGPNPFHVREFTYDEFREELQAVFSTVQVFTQNHCAAIAFADQDSPEPFACETASAHADPKEAQFFVAVCSPGAARPSRSFVFLPRAANILRERENHVRLLEAELKLKSTWLGSAQKELATLNEEHTRLNADFATRSEWALQNIQELEKQNQELAENVDKLVDDLAKAVDALHASERTVQERTDWARQLDTEIHDLYRQRAELQSELESTRESLEQQARTQRALELRLQVSEQVRMHDLRQIAKALQIQQPQDSSDLSSFFALVQEAAQDATKARTVLHMISESRWIHIGRKLGVGPKLEEYDSLQ